MQINEKGAELSRFFAVMLLGCCVWLPSCWKIGWIQDDNYEVYGESLTPVPTLHQAFYGPGWGRPQSRLSPWRIFAFPFTGYAGMWLGPHGAHLFLGLLHLACGAAFYLILRRLGWSASMSRWATALFIVSPWITEPIFWWAAGGVVLPSTLLGQCAILAYLRWTRGGSLVFLSLTLVLIFLSNCWYELWLAIPICLLGIELNEPVKTRLAWRRRLIKSVLRMWPTLLPGLFWVVLVKFTYSGEAPNVPPSRWIRVILSVQLRVYNWFSLTPWRTAFVDGARALVTLPGLAIFSLVALSLWIGRDPNGDLEFRETKIPLLPSLFFGWMWFMSARIVLILAGRIDVLTRHNYPANMGVVFAVVAAVDSLSRRFGVSRTIVKSALAGGVLVGAIVSCGMGQAYITMR